ncbi:MAG: hypothetical protein GOMPHAMPRED_003322 [Gomphillus americanus]|uniref:Uncharacterized protein n=1 Tax=Gomphillus americanus TaxID=1940652 RepID=A0A8H3EI14_9LECA|nr:MAG: hypothetical protein GOMPHAMPRED_003322 [Gomphillus americanus]
MSLATMALAAPLPLSAPLASRDTGLVNIHNKCTFDIEVDTALPGSDSGTESIEANSTWTHQQINYGGLGQGISLKVRPTETDSDAIVQIEYTINDDMSLTFYDLSLINGNPFEDYVQNLTANGAGADVVCAQGAQICADAYRWADQVATKSAVAGTNLDFYLCGQ